MQVLNISHSSTADRLTSTSPTAGKAQHVAQSIKESGGKAIAVAGDMLDLAHIQVLVQKAAEFGEGKIHIIVNNAGFTWDAMIHKVG